MMKNLKKVVSRGSGVLKLKGLTLLFSLFLLLFSTNVAAAEKKKETWQDELIYYLIIDRFNNGDTSNDFDVNTNNPKAYFGGDFKGVTLQLDYIKDMGFTTIALSPVFDNEENGFHGYWVNDFKKSDEHFGTLADFKKLVKEAHKRNLKIIVDFPANSVGPNHPWIKDPAKQAWFNKNDQENPEKTWVDGLPDLNQENPEVQEYLIDVAKWWVKETGIDGYKLDRTQNVPESFWKAFSNEVDVFLLGDDGGADTVKKYTSVGIDGILDYTANDALRKGFSKPDQSLEELFTILESNQQKNESFSLMGNFMDNQRMGRFTHEAVVNNLHPGSRWKLALTYLFTSPGIPVIYYGSEIALEGADTDSNMKQMDFRTDKELVEYITKLGQLRNQLPSLTKGTMEPLYAKGGMMVFKREYDGEVTVVAINNTTQSQNVAIGADKIAEDKELRGLLLDDLTKEKDGKYNLILDRDEAEIYVLADKSGVNIPYFVVMGIVYVIFFTFIVMLIKRRKKRTTE
jgi:glycosidase